MGSKSEFSSRGHRGIADGEDTRVEHADDVSGIGLLDDLPLGGHQLLGAGAGFTSCRSAGRGRPPFRVKPAGADPRMKAIRSRWALFMLAWILKTKAGENRP